MNQIAGFVTIPLDGILPSAKIKCKLSIIGQDKFDGGKSEGSTPSGNLTVNGNEAT